MSNEQLALAGFAVPVLPARPRRHGEMIRLYGECLGERCAQCCHLVRKHGDHAGYFLKCEEAGITASAATDWRAGWPACGKWEDRSDG